MSTDEALASLPVGIDNVEYSRRQRETTSDCRRVSTVIQLRGNGETGRGEDVTDETADHDALQDAAPSFDLALR